MNGVFNNSELTSQEARENAVKEKMQEIILCGLSRAGFFKEAAFYGGTALRIFYGLKRFSEDLDFSLIKPNKDFKLEKYCNFIEKEIKSFGLNAEISIKTKTKDSAIKSAFPKGNTIEHIILFYGENDTNGIPRNKQIKIKFEVDTDPPPFAGYEAKYSLIPAPYEVRLYDAPSLFSGKIHAVLCRSWKNRIKGRDLYDYVFFLQNKIPVNLRHLKARLIQSSYLANEDMFDIEMLKIMLKSHFSSIDYENAKKDISPFIDDINELSVWNKDFFIAITDNLQETII